MSRRRRGLSPEEEALWTHVTRDVAPLKRRRKPKPAEPEPTPAVEAKAAASTPPPQAPTPRQKSVPPAVPPLAPLDRRERRGLSRGTRSIDARIDLHGMRQAEAHAALRHFLTGAQARGNRLVLVITGKGRSDAPMAEGERGVLRRVVPQWLRLAELRPFVVGFEEAHLGHGGEGALYVRLRRTRRGEEA